MTNQLETVKAWVETIDHIQLTSSTEVEDAMLLFYGKVLGLTEIAKPEALKGNDNTWYALGNIQLHISTEKNANNEASRRHICFQVADLKEFEAHLIAHGVEIISVGTARRRHRQPIPGYNRFYIRDPGGNRLEIVSAKSR
ncbi:MULTISPECIES: VOC family protein [Calothrix]|uniref:VOC family protein n=2 Tax=Calothrix TaxID=1186 RepID=A0ABR8AKI0_9CYAN|nr:MULTISPECIES: VOC family protein [Calothrix]MBD2200570.1 VOC family protein [Calothrix parietina FACHB-288]MBD2229608.1 VOC family protein [Calothrix anomala FACHB-343]